MTGLARATVAASLALATLLLPVPASPQDPPSDTVPRPFVRGGVYDKPYLASLFGRAAIGGYAEAHARWERVDGVTEELGFEARRFNLFASTRVSDFVRLGAELEIEEGGEEVTLEYAAVDLTLHPALNVRAGMILLPLGRFNLAHDSPMNEMTDRPLVAAELLGVALSQPGVGLFGIAPLREGGRITWEVYAVNGYDRGIVEDSGEGTRLPGGASNPEDENASPAFVGRATWAPSGALELGVSGYRGAWNRFEADGLRLDEKRNVTIGALDVTAVVSGVSLEGEGALVRVDLPPGLSGFFAEDQAGFYLQAMREFGRGWIAAMPDSRFAAGLRVDVVDFDREGSGDSQRRLTVGLNFRPTADTVVKLDWARGRGFDPFENREETAALLFSVATYF